jgi:Tfp pilus assembly protein PilF
MKHLFALGVFLSAGLLAADAHAQMGAVRGKVVDEAGAPVADAQVRLLFKGQLTKDVTLKTNKRGEYMQVGLPAGNYDITVTKEGFAPQPVSAKVDAGGPTDMLPVKLTKARAAAGPAQGASGTGDLRAAVNAAREGKFDEAEAAVKKVIAADPADGQAQSILGYVYIQKQDWPGAQAAYTKALELTPDSTDSVLGLAEAYQKQGNADKATEVLVKAAEANPQDGALQFSVGLHHLNANHPAEAAAALKKAQALTPDNPEVYFYLGTVAVGQNDIPGAVAHLEKYLSMSPSNAQNTATARGLLSALKPQK